MRSLSSTATNQQTLWHILGVWALASIPGGLLFWLSLPILNRITEIGVRKALALLLSHFQPEVVVPIGRRGYYPGALLAHLLEVKIYPVRVSRCLNDIVKYKEPQWIVPPPVEIAHRRVIVVDEICDSGGALLKVKEKCLALGASMVKSAVLYAHTKALQVLDYVGIIIEELLMNPWDREVYQDGGSHFNPEYAEALIHRGLGANAELLIPARVFRLAKE